MSATWTGRWPIAVPRAWGSSTRRHAPAPTVLAWLSFTRRAWAACCWNCARRTRALRPGDVASRRGGRWRPAPLPTSRGGSTNGGRRQVLTHESVAGDPDEDLAVLGREHRRSERIATVGGVVDHARPERAA